MKPKQKVIIFGGGVAGLSAAHELVERGFVVEIFEKNSIPGGKARSLKVPNSAKGKRMPLPGEHGFRFFPGFYQHLPETMSRIPYKHNKKGVLDNLTLADHSCMASPDYGMISFVNHFPRSLEDLICATKEAFVPFLVGISETEAKFFGKKLWQFLTSCEERRLQEYEKQSWWEYIQAKQKSKAYQKYFGIGSTKVLVASDPKRANARTICHVAWQLLSHLFPDNIGGADRILNGPTNDVWINPWLRYLTKKGVKYNLNAKLLSLRCEAGIISQAKVQFPKRKKPTSVSADYYICALPVEAMAKFVTKDMEEIDPVFKNFAKLKNMVNWMNGIQYYLKNRLDIVDGHVTYLDSPWALTSISQGQFWPKFPLKKYGNGKIKSILSVDISDWNSKGLLYKKTAKQSTPNEIAEEVWYQMKISLNTSGKKILTDKLLDSWFLDPDIQNKANNPHKLVNTEPLLVNLKNSWNLRPKAHTKIKNLFLAADYVQTYTDLATMEGANEAARRAVNKILDALKSNKPRCKVWPFPEPAFLAPFKLYDYTRFKRGLPWTENIPLGFKLFANTRKHASHVKRNATRYGKYVRKVLHTRIPNPKIGQ